MQMTKEEFGSGSKLLHVSPWQTNTCSGAGNTEQTLRRGEQMQWHHGFWNWVSRGEKWDSLMEAVWHFPAEAASATCNINLSVPGLDFAGYSSSCTCCFCFHWSLKIPLVNSGVLGTLRNYTKQKLLFSKIWSKSVSKETPPIKETQVQLALAKEKKQQFQTQFCAVTVPHFPKTML